jgi:transcriptional regulator with XRE-family HTH domain
MAALNSGKIIRRVRERLDVSQEGLSRLMNTTKGAVQHWERGRNNPGLGRLLALRQICPPSPERRELDALIHGNQDMVGRINPANPAGLLKVKRSIRQSNLPTYPAEGSVLLRRENGRLQRQVSKLETALKRRDEQLRILENLATDLQREMTQIRAKH